MDWRKINDTEGLTSGQEVLLCEFIQKDNFHYEIGFYLDWNDKKWITSKTSFNRGPASEEGFTHYSIIEQPKEK